MKEMDLEKQRIDSLENEAPPEAPETAVQIEGDQYISVQTHVYGTLEIEGDGSYYVFLSQTRSVNTWSLTTTDIFNASTSQEKQDCIVAVLRVRSTGRMEGMGKTYILSRLMSNLSSMIYMAVNNENFSAGWFATNGEYEDKRTGSFIRFKAEAGGKRYTHVELVYEGFRMTLDRAPKGLPTVLPQLQPVMDTTDKSAITANLGIKTAAMLFRSMGARLDWYKKKNYKLVSTKEEFEAMMSAYLDAVQAAADKGKAVLTGLDTETTGLNMYDLSVNNPMRDNVVAIPFGWKDNEGYVICTDMYYFSNVDGESVYPLFTTLFRRNDDYSFQDIELDYSGKHYSFNRSHIVVAGWNVMFDEQAFFTEGADIFFDEDGRQLYFNLDTDLQQGQAGFQEWGSFTISNSLKMQTRRMIGDETLELDELFGKGHEDKFRYLQDQQLVLIYGGADADYTRACVRKGISMTEPALYKQYRKYDMTTMYRMAKAAWQGMPIDSEKVREMGSLVAQDLELLQNFIYHYAWLANRDTLRSKTGRLQELLGVSGDTEIDELKAGDQMFRYPFTPANHKKLLFQLLGYPVLKRSAKSSEPALDKFVLEKLMGPKRENPVEIMTQDVMSISDPSVVLIDHNLFNSDMYPLARVFKTYATYSKEYISYYKPIIENDMEGRMFYNFTLARAATRRILSPGQTMKSSLKSLVVAPPGKIFMSFDASQIEYRHMASLAYIRTKNILKDSYPEDWERRLDETSISKIFALMQKEEADYHIETAASMTGVRQHEVTPKVRKRYKSIGFGIPYGLGERAMCESMHSGVVNDQTMAETRTLLADYKKKQCDIIDLLESTRDSAFVPAKLSEAHRAYLGVGDSPVGIVRNFVGFYRVFILENLTRARTGRIRRQAGNCIIQGGAAELFRRMLYNFHVGCCKAGIQNKIQWLMTVHDELDAIIDADIDIMALIKVLYENCTLRYIDHIPYYIGINFGANWRDAKADANELPVIMVQRMIAAYDAGKFSIPSDGNQADNLLLLKRHYMCDRVCEELLKIFPALGPGHEWTDEDVAIADDKFENYVVRSYLDVFCKEKHPTFKQSLQAWQAAREEYGFGVSFLQTKLQNAQESVSLDDMDLSIELLAGDEEDMAGVEDATANWFNEGALFDHNASVEDILVEGGDSFIFMNDDRSRDEDDFRINEDATNAFDLFVSTHYVRTKVLKTTEGKYSALTSGSDFSGNEVILARKIKKHFSPGSDTIILIGSNIVNVPNINCMDEDLNWLDKVLTKKIEI